MVQPSVMTGGQPGRAQPACLPETGAELDAAVAAYVGVGGASRPAFAQHLLEDLLAVFLGKVEMVKDYAEFVSYAPGCLQVLRRGTGAIGLLPIGHVQGLHFVACIHKAQCRHRGVHPAGKRHHHCARHGESSLRQFPGDSRIAGGSQCKQRLTCLIR